MAADPTRAFPLWQFFGEMALLKDGQRRGAFIVSVVYSLIYSLHSDKLNPILDNRIGIFPGGQQFEINPEHRVIATANTWGTGADAEYVGRNRLDAASLDRFGARLEWDYDEAFERRLMVGQFGDNGERATTLSQSVRVKLRECGLKIVWGPRQTIGLARRLAAGLNAREAFSVSALAALSETNQGRVLDSLDLS